ncbi:hypothetical protein ABZ371_09555 [Streptomyces sp. NPDC005899]|uniref:hypothetical protein n=1 Tax=Streptomyces sp. NPDC005899 TaxID=3155716 RepID=UPI0033F98034
MLVVAMLVPLVLVGLAFAMDAFETFLFPPPPPPPPPPFPARTAVADTGAEQGEGIPDEGE